MMMVLLVLSSNKMHYHMRWEHCMIHCLPVRSLFTWTQCGLSVGNMTRTQTEKDIFLSLAPLFSLKSKSLPSGYHHNCWECSLPLCIFNAESWFLHDVSLDALLISSNMNWIQVYNLYLGLRTMVIFSNFISSSQESAQWFIQILMNLYFAKFYVWHFSPTSEWKVKHSSVLISAVDATASLLCSTTRIYHSLYKMRTELWPTASWYG